MAMAAAVEGRRGRKRSLQAIGYCSRPRSFDKTLPSMARRWAMGMQGEKDNKGEPRRCVFHTLSCPVLFPYLERERERESCDRVCMWPVA